MRSASAKQEDQQSDSVLAHSPQSIRILVALWSAHADTERDVIERIADELEAEVEADAPDDEIEDLYRKLNALLAEPPTQATNATMRRSWIVCDSFR